MIRLVEDSDLTDVKSVIRSVRGILRPPGNMRLSEWANRYYYMSAENSASPGKWLTLPYQREIMDAMTDPTIQQVTVLKSARVGYTLMVSSLIGYHIDQDPATVLVVQPTVSLANRYTAEFLDPMIMDTPRLSQIMTESVDELDNVSQKSYPGGLITLCGANSGAGLRSMSRRIVILDEVDAYPPTAGVDGDPVNLAINRSLCYWNRKIVVGSTPLVEGLSKIVNMFLDGDQRYFHVPCPVCGHFAPLVFSGDKGHVMTWPKDRPREAFFTCQKGGCVIPAAKKREIIHLGKWITTSPTYNHASFRIWAAYGFAANADWGQIAEEFVNAKKKGTDRLKVVVNQLLGETFKEDDVSAVPEHEILYKRVLAESEYFRCKIPLSSSEFEFITAGVDVQRKGFYFEVVAWCSDKQSYSVDAGYLPGDPASAESWDVIDSLLDRRYRLKDDSDATIRLVAIDSGDQAQIVYNWARKYPMSRVIAIKGQGSAKLLLGTPSSVDIRLETGERIGYMFWPVGIHIVKSELNPWLKLTRAEGKPYPPGYCHFPADYDEEFYKQLTAEKQVVVIDRKGFRKFEWHVEKGRDNHFLDTRVYARAAASACGLDRILSEQDRRKMDQMAPEKPPERKKTTPNTIQPPQPQARIWGRKRDKFRW